MSRAEDRAEWEESKHRRLAALWDFPAPEAPPAIDRRHLRREVWQELIVGAIIAAVLAGIAALGGGLQ